MAKVLKKRRRGRPPLYQDAETRSLYLSRSLWNNLDAAASMRGQSSNAFAAEVLQRAVSRVLRESKKGGES